MFRGIPMSDEWKLRMRYVFVFILFFALAVYWQFGLTIGDPDGFYHAKIAQFLSHGIVLAKLPWMQFSTLRDAYTDHHFLYHIALVPFVLFGKPLLGVKLATAFFTASFFSVLYWFLKRMNASAPFIFTALLATCASFTFRLGLIKANSLSLIMFLIILYGLFHRRWILLCIANALYVWLYGGWLLSWVAALLYIIVSYVFHGIHAGSLTRRLFCFWKKGSDAPTLKIMVSVIGGSLAGLIINPYFPQNIYFYWQQIWQIAIVNLGYRLAVGGEWGSLSPQEFASYFAFILIAYILSAVLLVTYVKKISVYTWTLFVLSLLVIIFTIKSQRYIELSAPMAVIFSALACTDVYGRNFLRDMIRRLPHDMSDKLIIGFSIAFLIFFFLPHRGIFSQITLAREHLINGIPFTRYEKSSQWLIEHSPPASIVVHSDWDDWPVLFYHNDHNYYIVGLDPTFMYNYNARLYDQWATMTRDGIADDILSLVTKDLHAQYVMIEKDHIAMNNLFEKNIYFRLVYQDDEVWIYRVAETIPT